MLIIVAPTATAKNATVSVVEGGNVSLSCVVTGDPFPDISWYSGEVLITEDTPSTFATYCTTKQ